MTNSKQYDCRVVQNDAGWMVEIVRRVSSKRSIVTKSQAGFASESEALEWGQGEAAVLLKKRNLSKSNKRRGRKPE